MKRGDKVVCKSMPEYYPGTVLRVSKDGSWCDVFWSGIIVKEKGIQFWSKRMQQKHLNIVSQLKEILNLSTIEDK